MELTEQKACMVCGEKQAEGITIVNEFICTTCEAEIVRTPVEDPQYSYFVRQLRQLWVKFHL